MRFMIQKVKLHCNKFVYSLIIIICLYSCTHSKIPPIQSNLPYQLLANFKGDTLKYLKYNFEEREGYFSGKRFELIINDLEIPVKTILPITSDKVDTCVGFIISFDDIQTFKIKTFYETKSFALGVHFEPYLNLNEVDKFLTIMKDSNNWNSALKSYFGSKIIRNTEALVYYGD